MFRAQLYYESGEFGIIKVIYYYYYYYFHIHLLFTENTITMKNSYLFVSVWLFVSVKYDY